MRFNQHSSQSKKPYRQRTDGAFTRPKNAYSLYQHV